MASNNTNGASWDSIQADYDLDTVLNALNAMEARKRYNNSDKARERRTEYNRRKTVLLRKAIEAGITVDDAEVVASI